MDSAPDLQGDAAQGDAVLHVPLKVSPEVDAELVRIEQEIAILHHSTRARVKALVEAVDPELQPAGFAVLRWVVMNGPVRAGGCAASLSMDKSAVSRQITVLRDGGLLQTRPDPEDGRATLLVPTAEALAAIERFRADVRASYGRALGEWSLEEISEFARLLQRFNGSLNQG
ncbi:MAG: MarR family transcriptional regulator [Glaciihabitans sp.]|nr:MarR family transcriptional regulator [Glaciihabitans sp.]